MPPGIPLGVVMERGGGPCKGIACERLLCARADRILAESKSASRKSTPTLCAGGLSDRRGRKLVGFEGSDSSLDERTDPAREIGGLTASEETGGKTPNSELVMIGETPSNMTAAESSGTLQTGFSSIARGLLAMFSSHLLRHAAVASSIATVS